MILTRLPPVDRDSRRVANAKKPRDARRGSASPGPGPVATNTNSRGVVMCAMMAERLYAGSRKTAPPLFVVARAPTPRGEIRERRYAVGGKNARGDHARNRRALHQRIDGVRDGTVGVDPPAGGVQRGSRARRLGGDVESVVLESEGRDVEREGVLRVPRVHRCRGRVEEGNEGGREGEVRDERRRRARESGGGERRDRRCRPEIMSDGRTSVVLVHHVRLDVTVVRARRDDDAREDEREGHAEGGQRALKRAELLARQVIRLGRAVVPVAGATRHESSGRVHHLRRVVRMFRAPTSRPASTAHVTRARGPARDSATRGTTREVD